MPKREFQKRIDGIPSTGAIAVTGGFIPSSTALSIRAILDNTGGATSPDSNGRLTVVGSNGVGIEAQSDRVILSVDGSVPRLSFTGKMIVGQGTTLLLNLPADGTFMSAAENTFQSGDLAVFQARGNLEYIRVTSTGTANAEGGYDFPITRNIDGSGADAWKAGDVIMRLGQMNTRHLELVGRNALDGKPGPSLLVKRQTGSGPTDWTPDVIAGNVKGRYGIPSDTDYWGIGAGTYGEAGKSWISADATNGLRIGVNTSLVGEFTASGDIKQYSGGVQRSHLDSDGSGWFVASDKFFWDTSGNMTIAAALRALTLQIGNDHGPSVRGGEVIDFDSQGDPIVTSERFGLRIYDESGLPRISLVTGTVDHPNVAAAMLGAEGDPNYLWFVNGALRLKGQAEIDGGVIGGFSINATHLSSSNNRVVLVSEAELELAEGVLLTSGPDTTAGVIAWRKTSNPSDFKLYEGILTTFQQQEYNFTTAQMLLGVSNLTGSSQGVKASLRLEVHTPTAPGVEKGYIDLWQQFGGSFIDTNAMLRIPSIAGATDPYSGVFGLKLSNVSVTEWIGPGDFCYITAAGTAGRLASDGSGLQSAASSLAMYFKLPVPAKFAGCQVSLSRLTIYYKTAIAGAYITNVSIIKQSLRGEVNAVYEYTDDLGNGTTGSESAQLLLFPVRTATDGQYLIKVTPTGVTDYGHVIIYGFLAEYTSE